MKLVDFSMFEVDFIWDYKLHFPIPTLQYIMNRSGIDILSKHDTTIEAEGEVLSIVRTARNFMYREKLNSEKRDIEYDMAHDIWLIYDVLEFVFEFIQLYYTSGEYDKLFMESTKLHNIPAIMNAYNLLPFVVRQPYRHDRKYYVGY